MDICGERRLRLMQRHDTLEQQCVEAQDGATDWRRRCTDLSESVARTLSSGDVRRQCSVSGRIFRTWVIEEVNWRREHRQDHRHSRLIMVAHVHSPLPEIEWRGAKGYSRNTDAIANSSTRFHLLICRQGMPEDRRHFDRDCYYQR